jgi:hypothetical protein
LIVGTKKNVPFGENFWIIPLASANQCVA